MQHNFERYLNKHDEVVFERTAELKKGEVPILLMERPKLATPVTLPLVKFLFFNTPQQRYGLHTDMLRCLLETLGDMSPKMRQGLYIQTRIPTKEQVETLLNHPVYDFFISARYFRIDQKLQQKAFRRMNQALKGNPQHESDNLPKLEVILPKRSPLTDEEIRKYARMEFSPETPLKKLEKMRVGWVQSNWLTQFYYQDDEDEDGDDIIDANSFLPLLGGCNKFNIGSNTMSGALVQKAAFALRDAFEKRISLFDKVVDKSLYTETVLNAFRTVEIKN